MHHLDQILIVLGCGCVLPIMVVWLIIRESMNKTNQRTQIVLAAIEKNPDMDIECMVQIPNIRYAAQEFRDDLVVYMIGMDENRKKWWSTIKEMDLRKKDLTQTDRPYEIQHSWAYDDKTGALLPGFKRLDIKTIPHNYLVDRSGRIIAKNISITLAIDKLQALLEKEKQQ